MVFHNDIAWEKLKLIVEKLNPGQIFVILDKNIEKYCLPYFKNRFNPKRAFTIIRIPKGEEHKNIKTCLYVWETLSEKEADRNSLIINLGGGVVTDLGGFVASTFKRGIPFINIPTSLLAMVDASVGGKTGIDFRHVKNQIGTITLPEMVLIDICFLKTLPEKQLLSGFAEMIKHSIIDGKDSWNELQKKDARTIFNQGDFIKRSIEIKQAIAREDPTEQGKRKILNFGHTLGHAIESHFLEANNHNSLLHGEAIAAGMILATYISNQIFNFQKLNEVVSYIFSLFPKQEFHENDIKNIIKLTSFDKKNRNGKVLFVLIEDFGEFKTDCIVDKELIIKAFKFYRNF